MKEKGQTILTPLVSLDTPGKSTVEVVIVADPVSRTCGATSTIDYIIIFIHSNGTLTKEGGYLPHRLKSVDRIKKKLQCYFNLAD